MGLALPQLRLFDDVGSATIAGLIYAPDFISAAQESTLLNIIDAQPWLTDLKRRVQHYGYKYDYKARGITQDLRIGAIPDWLAGLCNDLHTQGYFKQAPDQVIINEYLPGQGIAPHIDCVPCFGESVASLSLGSQCVMEFTHAKIGEKRQQLLEPRSLVVLSGESRYDWQHSIPGRKSDIWGGKKLMRGRRISLTFRTVILVNR
jgi:alkylated DNA repair dioxygenase AlkB